MSSDAEIDRQIEARNRRIRAGLEAPPAHHAPKPKPTDDEDDGPGYLTPAWHAARAAAEAKATAPPPPAEIPFAYRPENQPKRRKPEQHGSTPVGRARRAAEGLHIICEAKACGLVTGSFSHLCNRHRGRRRRYGSVKLTRHPLRLEDYQHFLIPARRYLRRNPPPPAIMEAMASFLRPADALPFDRRGRKVRAFLRQEMAWWPDPKAHKKDKHHGRGDYSVFGYIAHFVAVLAKIEELDGKGFPDGADLHALMRSLVLRHLRPGRRVVTAKMARESGPGIVKGRKRALAVSATVVNGLITRWRQKDRSDLRLFVAVTAKAVLAEMQAKREQQNRKATTAPKPVRQGAIVPHPQPSPKPEPPTPPAPPVRRLEKVRVDLPPRFKKPTYRPGGCSVDELRSWERVEAAWRQFPEGFWYDTKETNPDAPHV